jgi:hypothetical protein
VGQTLQRQGLETPAVARADDAGGEAFRDGRPGGGAEAGGEGGIPSEVA